VDVDPSLIGLAAQGGPNMRALYSKYGMEPEEFAALGGAGMNTLESEFQEAFEGAEDYQKRGIGKFLNAPLHFFLGGGQETANKAAGQVMRVARTKLRNLKRSTRARPEQILKLIEAWKADALDSIPPGEKYRLVRSAVKDAFDRLARSEGSFLPEAMEAFRRAKKSGTIVTQTPANTE
jgi:hypothetical protein